MKAVIIPGVYRKCWYPWLVLWRLWWQPELLPSSLENQQERFPRCFPLPWSKSWRIEILHENVSCTSINLRCLYSFLRKAMCMPWRKKALRSDVRKKLMAYKLEIFLLRWWFHHYYEWPRRVAACLSLSSRCLSWPRALILPFHQRGKGGHF